MGQPVEMAQFCVFDSEEEDLVRVVVTTATGRYEGEGEGYFEALCAVRTELEHDGFLPGLQGARASVYPSPMALSMGARRAYRLTMGQPARTKDLVDVFEPVDPQSVPWTNRLAGTQTGFGVRKRIEDAMWNENAEPRYALFFHLPLLR